MKIKLLITLAISCLFTSFLSAQHKKRPVEPAFNSINDQNVYLKYKKEKFHFYNIDKSSIQLLLGKPIKSKTAKSEISGLMYTEYTYPFGLISIEDGLADNIEINKPGLTYFIRIDNHYSKPIEVGSDASYLQQLFPFSWKHIQDNFIIVPFEKIDCTLSFKICGSKIKSISISYNES